MGNDFFDKAINGIVYIMEYYVENDPYSCYKESYYLKLTGNKMALKDKLSEAGEYYKNLFGRALAYQKDPNRKVLLENRHNIQVNMGDYWSFEKTRTKDKDGEILTTSHVKRPDYEEERVTSSRIDGNLKERVTSEVYDRKTPYSVVHSDAEVNEKGQLERTTVKAQNIFASLLPDEASKKLFVHESAIDYLDGKIVNKKKLYNLAGLVGYGKMSADFGNGVTVEETSWKLFNKSNSTKTFKYDGAKLIPIKGSTAYADADLKFDEMNERYAQAFAKVGFDDFTGSLFTGAAAPSAAVPKVDNTKNVKIEEDVDHTRVIDNTPLDDKQLDNAQIFLMQADYAIKQNAVTYEKTHKSWEFVRSVGSKAAMVAGAMGMIATGVWLSPLTVVLAAGAAGYVFNRFVKEKQHTERLTTINENLTQINTYADQLEAEKEKRKNPEYVHEATKINDDKDLFNRAHDVNKVFGAAAQEDKTGKKIIAYTALGVGGVTTAGMSLGSGLHWGRNLMVGIAVELGLGFGALKAGNYQEREAQKQGKFAEFLKNHESMERPFDTVDMTLEIPSERTSKRRPEPSLLNLGKTLLGLR